MIEPEIGDAQVSAPRIRFTRRALEELHGMLAEEGLAEEGGVRISARHGAGCSAPLRFGMMLEAEPEPGDLVLSAGTVRLFLRPDSAWSLDGLSVDYTSTAMGEGFAFRRARSQEKRSC